MYITNIFLLKIKENWKKKLKCVKIVLCFTLATWYRYEATTPIMLNWYELRLIAYAGILCREKKLSN